MVVVETVEVGIKVEMVVIGQVDMGEVDTGEVDLGEVDVRVEMVDMGEMAVRVEMVGVAMVVMGQDDGSGGGSRNACMLPRE